MNFLRTQLIYLVALSACALAQTASPSSSTLLLTPETIYATDSSRTSDAASAASSVAPGQSSSTPHPELLARYVKLPLAFEPNQGQTNSDIRFLARGGGYALFLTATDAILRLNANGKVVGLDPSFLSMRLVGADAKLSVSGSDELPGKTNYFIGNDPAKWRTNIPLYAKVHYSSVYPGVDLVYYGNVGRLEYDFVVSPGADPGAIRLAFEGALPVIDSHGDLVLQVGQDEVRLRKPVVYQEAEEHSGGRHYVDGRYRLTAGPQVMFELGKYDKGRSLVIDPILVYSTFLGGSSSDGAYGIFVDSAGNAYVTGGTNSTDFPTTAGAFQTGFGGLNGACTEEPSFQCGDAFVAKLNPTATALVWSTYLGGTSSETGFGVRADSTGVYVAGQTSSGNFPVTPGAFQTTLPAGSTRGGFVTKLSPDGSALLYSTYLSGSATDKLRGLAVDSGGNAYVTGGTQSDDFPHTAGAFQVALAGPSNAFVSKLNPTGSALVYSTFLGGTASDAANSITIDKSGNAYVTGGTTSTKFPTQNPIQAAFAGGGTTCPAQHVSICGDAFVAELNSTGSSLLFSTYLGGTGEDSAVGIVLDPVGNIYVSGGTDSADFPTTPGVVQTKFGGGSAGCATAGEACGDAFLTKINAAKTAFVYSTYLGGSGDDVAGLGLVIDVAGNIHMAGVTGSNNFPTTPNAVQTTFGGGTAIPNCAPGFVCGDAFVTKFSLDASTLAFSTYLGGSGDDGAGSIVQDAVGNDYIAGVTISPNFPVTAGVLQPTCGTSPLCNDGAGSDAFITKLAIPFPTTSLSPLSVNFGNQAEGIASSPMPLTLTNSGTDNLLITSIVDANGFAQTNNCPIAPAPLAPAGSCTIDITFTPSGTGPANDTLTITDDSAGSPHVVALTGVGQAPFQLTTTCTSLTVIPGQTAIYTVDLAPGKGFTRSVSLSCSGAPALAACTVSPSSMTLNGSATVQAKVTATTTPHTSVLLRAPFDRSGNYWTARLGGIAGMIGLSVLVMLPSKRRVKGARRLYGWIFLLCVLSTVATLSSCGVGGGAVDPPGTAAGTYPLTVTATSQSAAGASITQQVSFNLVVQ